MHGMESRRSNSDQEEYEFSEIDVASLFEKFLRHLHALTEWKLTQKYFD